MSDNLYINFRSAIEWQRGDGTWVTLEDIQEVSGYSLPSSSIKLRINTDHPELSDYYISNNYIQWHVGNTDIVRGNYLDYTYYVPGMYNIFVYIQRSDGRVISLGNAAGQQDKISARIKNVISTNIYVKPTGEEGDFPVGDWQRGVYTEKSSTGQETEIFSSYIAHTYASKPTKPISITTTHSWQHYDETPNPYVVTLYASNAGLVFSKDNIRGNESAPLKTSSYDKNKYAQFQKTWRFTSDPAGLNPIDRVQTTIEKIYACKNTDGTYTICDQSQDNAEFVGTSGVDHVYYIDDSPVYEYENGAHQIYRLMFQLDTTNWPGRTSWTHLDTKSIKESPDYETTPGQMQAPQDFIRVDVHRPEIDRVVFTSTGVNTHHISKNKFQNSKIPFVVSLGDSDGNIIKDDPRFRITEGDVYVPWDTVNLDNILPGAYYVGLSSSNTIDANDIHIVYDENLSDINLYSSAAFTLSADKPVYDCVLVGAVYSEDTGVIIGTSSKFDILPNTGKHVFFKDGEEIAYGDIVADSILQENVNQHSTVVNMFKAVLGQFENLPDSAGKIIYEKIHNFTANNTDVDRCNVKALYGLAGAVNRTLQDYDINYPGSVKRIVDMLSTGIRTNIGTRNQYVEDYHKHAITDTSSNSVRYGRNIGTEPISVETYMVTAGQPLMVKELYGDNRFKIITSIVPGLVEHPGRFTNDQNLQGMWLYPLSAYEDSWNWGLTYPERNKFHDYYEFYEYIDNNTYPTSGFEQNSGMINWDATNELTSFLTLKESVSSYDDWYGQDGVIETNLQHALCKGLGIINQNS